MAQGICVSIAQKDGRSEETLISTIQDIAKMISAEVSKNDIEELNHRLD